MNVTTELILSIIGLQQDFRFTVLHNMIVWHKKSFGIKTVAWRKLSKFNKYAQQKPCLQKQLLFHFIQSKKSFKYLLFFTENCKMRPNKKTASTI